MQKFSAQINTQTSEQTPKLDELQITLGFNNFMDCAKLRVNVFIYEQGFSKDLDEIDLLPITQHICAYTPDGDCVGCLRYFPIDDNGEPAVDKHSSTWSIGRLTIAKQMRGKGLGSTMLSIGEAEAALAGAKHIELHAQCNKQPFYELHGYVAHGQKDKDEFMDHIWMGKDL